jgi:S1-C subfamily serine protease
MSERAAARSQRFGSSIKRALVGASLFLTLMLIGLGGVLPSWQSGAHGVSAQVATGQSASTTSSTVADVAEKANPAVVTISSTSEASSTASINGAVVPGGEVTSTGSGFIFDNDGHVLTNNHVVEGVTTVKVAFSDGSSADAKVVGRDAFQDVAVLKLDLTSGQKLPGGLKTGDSSSVRAGDDVIAIGTPLGEYSNTVSTGIIGAVNRSLDTGSGYRLPHLLQHDAALYPGNSGGPLLNAQGEVIGMNVAKATDPTMRGGGTTNIDFAIEIDVVMKVARQLIDDGQVHRPYLGITGESTDNGLTVQEVTTDGPARDAGITAGDEITQIDGAAIDTDHPLLNQLFDHQPGDPVKLTVTHNGDDKEITVKLGERPADV